jgi:hypothetical protein
VHGPSQPNRKKGLALSESFARGAPLVHTPRVTLPDFGPERPGQASDTRQMVERGRTETGGDISSRTFVIALAVIAIGIALVLLLLR